MMKTKMESNPRLLNLNRQTDPTANDFVAEEVESDDPDAFTSQIETNSIERFQQRRTRYEKNQVAARAIKNIHRATSEISQNKVLEKRRMMFNVINMARKEGSDAQIQQKESEIDQALNSAYEFDVAGRQILWENDPGKYYRKEDTCCYK